MATNKVVFRIQYGDDYVLQMIRTWLHYRKGARRERLFKVFIGVLLAAFFIMCAVLSVAIVGLSIYVSILFVVLSIAPFLLISSRRLDERIMIRRMRKSTGYGLDYHIEISDSGYSAWSVQTSATLSWGMFTSALQVIDGIMLFQGRSTFHWLPFNCLSQGTPEDSIAIISRSVGEYEIYGD